LKKLTKWLLLFLLPLILFNGTSGCSVFQKKTVEYKDVPPNTIISSGTAYSITDYMVVKRTTYLAVWNSLIEKDSQLKECLERERIKK